MSETAPARARISLRDGVFEFDGSIDFVSRQLERYHPLIEQFVTNAASSIIQGDKAETGNSGESTTGEPVRDFGTKRAAASNAVESNTPHFDPTAVDKHFGLTVEEVQQLIHFEDGIKILAVLTGNNADQTRRLSLMYCLAKDFVAQGQVVLTEELRELCNEHGCYDKNNFARHLKNMKQLLVPVSKGASSGFKITPKGKEEARKNLAVLVGAAS